MRECVTKTLQAPPSSRDALTHVARLLNVLLHFLPVQLFQLVHYFIEVKYVRQTQFSFSLCVVY